MFSKNLRYFRLKKGMTKKALADQANVTPMAITNYESGKRKPDMETMKRLAKALDVRVSDFLATRSKDIVFAHGEFRKNTKLSQSQQDFVREATEEYFSRFMTIQDILGGTVLPDAPNCYVLPLTDHDEENAASLRKYLDFPSNGPIEGLTSKLENKGILIYECDVGNRNFSGMNGFIDDMPYIVINPSMTPERIRSTIVHELAHLMFAWPENMQDEEIEKKATSISGAFLFPKNDAIHKLGIRRSSITNDMTLVAKEYGISMMLLVKRSEIAKIISHAVAQNFFIRASQAGWRTAEPSRIKADPPSLFKQLVYRAVNEQEISIQRGAELLQQPYDEVAAMCCLNEV